MGIPPAGRPRLVFGELVHQGLLLGGRLAEELVVLEHRGATQLTIREPK